MSKTFWASPEFVKLTGQDDASYRQATELRFPGLPPRRHLPHVRASFRSLHTGAGDSGAFDARIVRADGETRWNPRVPPPEGRQERPLAEGPSA